jgi:hypothetical protein
MRLIRGALERCGPERWQRCMNVWALVLTQRTGRCVRWRPLACLSSPVFPQQANSVPQGEHVGCGKVG